MIKQFILNWAIGLIVIGGIMFLAFPSFAHKAPSGWKYDIMCCSNRDCTEINPTRVTVTGDGYHIELVTGDHDMVTAPISFDIVFSDRRIKDSPDGAYHACISPNQRLLCFYRPPNLF